MNARLGRESGQALIASLLLLAGVLLPLLFLVPLFARVEQGRLATEQAARAAVRAAVQAPTTADAQAAAQAEVGRSQAQTGEQLELRLEGALERGAIIRAHVHTTVVLANIPIFGKIGSVTLVGNAAAPVDRYRSLTSAASP